VSLSIVKGKWRDHSFTGDFERKVRFCFVRRHYSGIQVIHTRRLWKWVTLSTGAPLRNLEGSSFTGTLQDHIIWGPFSWTQRMLGVYIWGQSETSIKEQDSHDLASEYGAQRA
jgi:hypothetical protein